AIMYADRITKSMRATIDETNYRREKQMEFNRIHNITPTAIKKSFENALAKSKEEAYAIEQMGTLAAEHEAEYLTKAEIEKKIRDTRQAMEDAAKDLDFITAAKLRIGRAHV